MSWPTVFANLPGSPATNPASLIDTMFNLTGGMGAIPCTATGTNAITVTPITNYYLPAAYANYQIISFVAANNATGAVTIQLGALGFRNLYMPSGLQANSGDITANTFYIASFNAALNSGSGGFQVFNASTPSVVQGVVGSFKNLRLTNGGSPDTQIAVQADYVMLGTSGGGTTRVSSVSVTISTAASGANGLDSGTIAAATFYAIYVIYNGTTIAGLISTSGTNPTLPSGYTFFARVGWISTGTASSNLTRIVQIGRRVQYVVTTGTQTPNLPIAATVTAANVGDTSIPTWVAVNLATIIPTGTAIAVFGSLWVAVNGAGNETNAMVAPNNSYGPITSQTNPAAFVAGCTANAGGTAQYSGGVFSFVLESTNIYWATLATHGGATISILGWEDNIGG